jgi:biopolymer transport protein ExbB
MKPFVVSLLASAVWSAALCGQSFQATLSEAERDLDSALSELADLRESIAEEKIPLSRTITDLSAEARTLRQQASRVQRLRDNAQSSLSDLQSSVDARAKEVEFISNLLKDLTARYESDVHIAELQQYTGILDETRSVLDDPDSTDEEEFAAMLSLVNTSFDRMAGLIGGVRIEGDAISPGGINESGAFVLLGPAAYFAGGDTAGIIERSDSLQPLVRPIGDTQNAQITSLVADGSGLAPIDSTSGKALALEASRETIWEHIQKGGVWIWPILGFAFVAMVVALFKAYEIYAVKLPKPSAVHETLSLLHQGKKDEAIRYTRDISGPGGEMLQEGVKHSDSDRELIEEVLYQKMLETQPKVERFLPLIAVTAATAPLMGLLGTVTGMINTFKLITIFGTGDAKSLSSGISEALVTTEFGLIVAIPALIAHAILARRAQSVMGELERTALTFVNGLPEGNKVVAKAS